MERKYKAIFFIIYLLFLFTIISIPSFILLAKFSNYGKINQSLTYVYSSTTPPLKSELNLNADKGIVDINYVNQPVDYIIKVDVNIEMSGPNLDGKSYLDFFNIVWENITTSVNFTLEIISDMLLDFSKLLQANIYINFTLRADVIFDINASIIDGAIKLAVPFGTTVNNLFLNVINGNIIYDMYHCTVEGNISGIVNTGDIVLKAYNSQYNQNCKLKFVNEVGHITIDIYQIEEMGANITGTGITKTGIITLIYNDYSPNIGAQFILNNQTGFGTEGQNTFIGFERETLSLTDFIYFFSNDFPTQNNYNFSLYKHGLNTDGGYYFWNLYSVPI
ncbi:MAG: hypothetical protein ACFE8M_04400 [Candidatus Hermodarchaeota archaeon]